MSWFNWLGVGMQVVGHGAPDPRAEGAVMVARRIRPPATGRWRSCAILRVAELPLVGVRGPHTRTLLDQVVDAAGRRIGAGALACARTYELARDGCRRAPG
jgi:hypothetical protein